MEKVVSWVEIPAVDFERAVKFYRSVFGWKLEPIDYGSEKMACLPQNAGAISFARDFKPSADGVLVSFNTSHQLDAVLGRITENGGTILIPKTKIEAEGMGWFATFLDCEGNRVGLYGYV
ncbi:VOC family protein [Alkaliflexus imshenetskii]|uniref:VOC family protein n=1 Tax=Alkaliflexus imshenetskii TaxID=286730 RepID=UPI00047CA15D|nr:VOC family protein [Alkaliflexus imshenetskii]